MLYEVITCQDCWNDVKKSTPPKHSIWNNVFTDSVPDVMSALNTMELLFVSPVRSCKKIIRLTPVGAGSTKKALFVLGSTGYKGSVMHLPVGLVPNINNVGAILPAADMERFLLQGIPNKEKMTVRITSYNVCYTKLLRSSS